MLQDHANAASLSEPSPISTKSQLPGVHEDVVAARRVLVRALVSGAAACKRLSKLTDALDMLSSAADIEPAVQRTHLEPLKNDIASRSQSRKS